MCIKELQLMKYRMWNTDNLESDCTNSIVAKIAERKVTWHLVKDYFLINEFPFNSAFCYLFRKYQIKSSGKCFCPMNCKRKFCVIDEETHTAYPMSVLMDKVERIPITNIMKYLKRIQISKEQLKHLSLLWNIFIKTKLSANRPNSTIEIVDWD